MLLVAVLLLSVGLFAAWKWKSNHPAHNVPQQNWQQWPNQTPQTPPVTPNPLPQQPSPPSQPQSPMPQPKTYAEAISQAKQSGKQVFLYFGTDWCGHCKEMKAKTFSDPQVKTELGRFIVLIADANKEKQAASKYQVISYPTYLIIDANETELKRAVGFKSPAEFNQWIGDQNQKPDRKLWPRR